MSFIHIIRESERSAPLTLIERWIFAASRQEIRPLGGTTRAIGRKQPRQQLKCRLR